MYPIGNCLARSQDNVVQDVSCLIVDDDNIPQRGVARIGNDTSKEDQIPGGHRAGRTIARNSDSRRADAWAGNGGGSRDVAAGACIRSETASPGAKTTLSKTSPA